MTQKEKLIKLGMTEAEADQVLTSDRQIDKMTCMADINADLSEEQKKAVKQAKNVKSYTKTARKPKEKVENAEKVEIIAQIADCLTPLVDCLSVENAERVIKFTKNGQNYSITLTKHRKQAVFNRLCHYLEGSREHPEIGNKKVLTKCIKYAIL